MTPDPAQIKTFFVSWASSTVLSGLPAAGPCAPAPANFLDNVCYRLGKDLLMDVPGIQ